MRISTVFKVFPQRKLGRGLGWEETPVILKIESGGVSLNILLVYPAFPETFWGFQYAIRFICKKSAYPPLGLLTVAALLPQQWGKRLIDLNTTTLAAKDLEWADLVFVGAMAIQKDSAQEVISRCKKASLKVVAGGPLFTARHQDFDAVDHFVLNEAELTLPRFLVDQ